MKRIVFISKDASWQKYRNDLFLLLTDKYDYSVEILTTRRIKSFIEENEKVRYIRFYNLFPDKWKISFAPGILIYILRKKPDIIIGLNNVSQITEFVANLLSKLLKTKYIWWTHAYDHGPFKTVLKNKYLRRIRDFYKFFFFRIADSIITFSEVGKKYLIRSGIKKNKIYCAQNTLNTNQLFSYYEKTSKEFTKEAILKQYNILKDSKIVLFCARLHKRKKVDFLIESFSYVNKKNIYLLIVGDGPEREALEQQVKEKNISNVLFLGAIFDEHELSKIFYVSDLFAMTGAVGLSIVHSFCYRLPIITQKDSNHGPEFQYFKDEYNGVLVESYNPEDFAKEIIRILSDEELLHNLKRNAFSTAKTECNVNLMVDNFNNALESTF